MPRNDGNTVRPTKAARRRAAQLRTRRATKGRGLDITTTTAITARPSRLEKTPSDQNGGTL
jgi:hypothetical protein